MLWIHQPDMVRVLHGAILILRNYISTTHFSIGLEIKMSYICWKQKQRGNKEKWNKSRCPNNLKMILKADLPFPTLASMTTAADWAPDATACLQWIIYLEKCGNTHKCTHMCTQKLARTYTDALFSFQDGLALTACLTPTGKRIVFQLADLSSKWTCSSTMRAVDKPLWSMTSLITGFWSHTWKLSCDIIHGLPARLRVKDSFCCGRPLRMRGRGRSGTDVDTFVKEAAEGGARTIQRCVSFEFKMADVCFRFQTWHLRSLKLKYFF